MSPVPQIVFLVNLLQDVNILRPLLYLAAAEFDAPRLVLVSERFAGRDAQGIWVAELNDLAARTGSALHSFNGEWAAFQHLQGRGGVIVAASESSLSNHAVTHGVFRVAPSSYLKITLQHGFECVGFLQNRDHNKAHGRNVRFAADVICGWCERATLTSIVPSEAGKLYVSGPSTLLDAPADVRPDRAAAYFGGLVCENLHSARLNVGPHTQASFLESFEGFCGYAAAQGDAVAFRSHPGGQYALKNGLRIPPNVRLVNDPIYRLDLSAFDWGISAPSSIVFDMILARLPVALWQDPEGLMDIGNYRGLPVVSAPRDWIDFGRQVAARRAGMLENQARFLAGKRMVTSPVEIRDRFLRLIGAGLHGARAVQPPASGAPKRVLFLADAFIPTLQLSFLKPLAADVERGDLVIDILTESEMVQRWGEDAPGRDAEAGVMAILERFAPDVVVFCRYSGPHAAAIRQWAQTRGTPVVFHVDDDLLNVPAEIGKAKAARYNQPRRLGTVGGLLRDADLVYCSTAPLRDRFRSYGYGSPMISGKIYCSAEVSNAAEERPVTTIGYMGFDHAHDFELILGPLVELLRARPALRFELFGSIPKPDALGEFGDRVVTRAPVRNYGEFLRYFASLNWDIGLCPLADTPFNRLKANTKWVEYTSVGAAVIASARTVYDECCADGCGILAGDDAEWLASLLRLCDDASARFRMVWTAQEKLRAEFSPDALRRQVHAVFDTVARNAQLRDLSTAGARQRRHERAQEGAAVP